MNKIINICFSQSAGATLKHTISTKELQDNEKVIVLFDNLSQGAIKGSVNIEERINWYNILEGEDPLEPFIDYDIEELKENYNAFYDAISRMDSSDALYLWYGSSREFCGMLYTLELLKGRKLNIYTIDVKDTVIKRKEIVFQVRTTGEIIPENIEKYAASKRKLNSNEYKQFIDNWESLKKDNSILRVLKNGKVRSVDESYFDIAILKYTPKEFRKSIRTLGEVLGKSEDSLSDEYIFWRIKELIKTGKIEHSGKFGAIRMEIKITEEGLKYLSTDKDAMKIWEEDRKVSKQEEELKNKYREKGRMEERIDIAQKLKDVLDAATIADKTGLSVEEVENLEGN
jgi:DNA-binding Lrp family transcriptional regulator